MTFAELVCEWNERAAEKWVPAEIAAVLSVCADELSDAIRDHDHALLSPKEASQECALAEKTIRKMLADGRLNNAGSPGRPKVIRRELHAAANRSVARRLHVV